MDILEVDHNVVYGSVPAAAAARKWLSFDVSQPAVRAHTAGAVHAPVRAQALRRQQVPPGAGPEFERWVFKILKDVICFDKPNFMNYNDNFQT